jgi:hypothetical protein
MNDKLTQPARSGHLLELLILAFGILAGAGFFSTAQFDDFLGYTVVLFAAMLPAALWIRSGIGGIPIFPTGAILYWVYCGLPSLRGVGEKAGYTSQHVLEADLLISLFLVAATIAWSRFLRPPRNKKNKPPPVSAINGKKAVLSLVAIGLSAGVAYFVIIYSNINMGSIQGIIRAVLLAPMILACYLLGYGKAKGMFSSIQWIAALGALFVVLILQLGGLQLIAGVTEMSAGLAGYVFTAKRIPWVAAVLVMVLVSILQAGKAEIRDRYANINVTGQGTLTLASDWFSTGLNVITKNTKHASVADRASLLEQVIRVQQWTPERVPYLYGESYTYLPSMIVPRIFNPNRAPTQVVMGLLDVRYHFLTKHDTLTTAVGINFVPEAFANFGYTGVAIIGALFGIFTGYFMQISVGREATSLPTLLAITAMVDIINMEADVSYMVTTFFQSSIAIIVFYYGLQFAFGRRKPALANSRA